MADLSKSKPCRYQNCWEDTIYNRDSPYCKLHQKVIKNSSIDLFNTISQKLTQQEWELFTSEIIAKNYLITLDQLSEAVKNFTDIVLTKQQKRFIYETYQVNRDDEDCQLINMKDLVSNKLT